MMRRVEAGLHRYALQLEVSLGNQLGRERNPDALYIVEWRATRVLGEQDVQESFRNRPYWTKEELPAFVTRLQGLIDR